MKEDALTGMTAAGGSPQDAPAPRLPTEICGRIIDHVAAGLDIAYLLDGNPHLLALRSCALVCRDWYYHTWYHLRQRVHLRDRDNVRSLSRTLRDRPRLRDVVQQVIISGRASRQQSMVQHLGLFTAMLAGKLLALQTITIKDAEWTVGSMRMEGFGYLATFNLVRHLEIINVTVPSIAHLAHLISALPGLSFLRLLVVNCSLQKHPASLVSLPLNSANLDSIDVRWVAPAIEEFLVRIIQEASRVRCLEFGVASEVNIVSMGSRSQTLLDAGAASVEDLQLWISPNLSASGSTVDAAVERHYNLSRHESLWRLEINLYHPFGLSWISHIISRITSKHLMAMSVMFCIRADHAADDVDRVLTMMEEDNILVQLDDTLQTECFANIAPGGVCLGFDHDGWLSYQKLFGEGTSFRERCNQWDELMIRKLVGCNGRGILTTAHGAEERSDWQRAMHRIQTKIRSPKTKTAGGAQQLGEDQPEHTTDTSG